MRVERERERERERALLGNTHNACLARAQRARERPGGAKQSLAGQPVRSHFVQPVTLIFLFLLQINYQNVLVPLTDPFSSSSKLPLVQNV